MKGRANNLRLFNHIEYYERHLNKSLDIYTPISKRPKRKPPKDKTAKAKLVKNYLDTFSYLDNLPPKEENYFTSEAQFNAAASRLHKIISVDFTQDDFNSPTDYDTLFNDFIDFGTFLRNDDNKTDFDMRLDKRTKEEQHEKEFSEFYEKSEEYKESTEKSKRKSERKEKESNLKEDEKQKNTEESQKETKNHEVSEEPPQTPLEDLIKNKEGNLPLLSEISSSRENQSQIIAMHKLLSEKYNNYYGINNK